MKEKKNKQYIQLKNILEEALISAMLLTGEMPKTIDQKFTQLG